MQHKSFEFEVKDVGADGTFAGYLSVWDVVDSQKETVARGAFVESLTARQAKGRKLPILWQHRSGEPIGVYDAVREDTKGLYTEGRLLVKEVARAGEAHALLKAGAVTGQSIGYRTLSEQFDRKTSINNLLKLDLQEGSIVTFPSNDEARIEMVKAAAVSIALKAGELPSLSDFEDFLREAGFSKTQATAIAGKGLRVLRSESDSDKPGDFLAALQSFQL